MVPTRHAQVRAAQRQITYHRDIRRRILLPPWLASEVYHGWRHKGLRVALSGTALLVCIGRSVVTTVRPSRDPAEIIAILLLHGAGFPRTDLI